MRHAVSWLLTYLHTRSLTKSRKIGFVLIIIASLLILYLTIRYDFSFYAGFSTAFATFCFGLGFRIGEELKYLLFGIILFFISVIINSIIK